MLELARIEDFEAVNRIAKQVCELHASWGSCMVVEHPYPMDYFAACIDEQKLYVARRNGIVVGYICCYFWQAGGPAARSRKMVSIDDIGVDSLLRNQGIGTEMMAELCEIARHAGCAALQLYVDAPNQDAIAFYQKCGLHIKNHGMLMNL